MTFHRVNTASLKSSRSKLERQYFFPVWTFCQVSSMYPFSTVAPDLRRQQMLRLD